MSIFSRRVDFGSLVSIFLFCIILSPSLVRAEEKPLSYLLAHAPYLNPSIIEELNTGLADTGDQIVAINLSDAIGSNRYCCDDEIQVFKPKGENPYVYKDLKSEDKEPAGSFGYQYIGKTASGVYVLQTTDDGGGSGVFQSLMLVVVEKDKGATLIKEGNGAAIKMTRERILIKKLGTIALGDRYAGQIRINKNELIIGKDVGRFAGSVQGFGLQPFTGKTKDTIICINYSNQKGCE